MDNSYLRDKILLGAEVTQDAKENVQRKRIKIW